MNHDWLTIAKRQFPGWVVGGAGRYALHSPSFGKEFGKIQLFETREECVRNILDPKHAFCVDLMPAPAPKCMNRRDDAEDRKWERRFDEKNA